MTIKVKQVKVLVKNWYIYIYIYIYILSVYESQPFDVHLLTTSVNAKYYH